MQQTIIRGFPRADIAVGFVWVNMLPLDNRIAASFRALTMQAPCVRHFHDPGKQAGRIIARSLGAQGKVAWDIYLFYPQGVEWADSPPPPATWAHQLSPSSWADPARYRRGDDLREELTKAMNQAIGPSGKAS